ncbi:nuclear receptor corepressor 2 isoform X2 [Diachasmimorpha longicaudata]|uniref:nuclear receptor corepressor 2 isoform X2 n=1 Tax=Diachasmimorpha longicaudata TaxID=58733 RepID=UPI0030B87537
METVGKQVQVVSGLGVGGPVGGDLHHHHHPHPHGGHGHSLVGGASTPARVQAQTHQGQPPPPSHNQHLPARSTPGQLHRPNQNYINIKSNSPVPPRTVAVSSYGQGGTGTPSVAGVGPPGNSGTGSTVGVTGSGGGNYVTVPVPSGLRYVHSYQPPPVPSAPVNQTPPPPGAAAAYTRDPYRNATSNVSERVAISVSSSPVSQVGVGVGVGANEYPPNSRGDRPRISLLPPASVAPSQSPTNADYHVTSNRNQRVLMPILGADQYGRQVEMATLQEAPPFKKIRLGQPQQQPSCQTISPADVCIKQDHAQLPQPLRIDTRPTAGAYTPQTEAISPTLPEPTIQEDAAFRVTKDELLQQIGKVDREIAKREGEITTRRKKLKTLEETANKPLEPSGLKRPVEEQSQPKHQSPAQKIYAENRKKAEEAHRLLDRLGQKVELPLYNQPSDTNVYQENKTRHQTCMRTRLIARLRREHSERASLHRQQAQTYAILVQEWHRKVERLESAQKRKSKETKNREFFEKVFPELRKQREDKERFNRVGARIKSEADLEEIMDGLQEQEEEVSAELKKAIAIRQMEDKKMRSYAVIPPLLLDAKQRRIAFQNRNGLLQPEELEALHSERKLINVWSAVEHELFKEKYLQHPKNFGAIAQNLEHKSVPDCVHHYYLTKKAENYKQLLRKSRQRTRSSRNNPNNKVNNSNSSIGPIDILTTGVTTRLQREQQQKTQENPQNNSTSTTTSSTTTTTNTPPTTTTITTSASSSSQSTTSLTTSSSTASDTGIVTTAASVQSTTASTTTVLTTSTSSAKEAREANKENKENKNDTKESVVKDIKEEPSGDSTTRKDTKSVENSGGNSCASVVGANETVVQTFETKDKKKQAAAATANVASNRTKDKKKENHAAPMETSDEEAQTVDPIESGRQLGPHACAICQNVVEGGNQSRALSRSQASQYGLREDQVQSGARVCNTCRCKAVRGRYTACPLPGCPNVNNANNKTRVKRLRALPPKWMELPSEIRDPVIQEFQIPSNTTKCCSACFNRISRRLAPHLSGGVDAFDEASESIARQWTEDELKQMRRALRELGTNWSKISEQIPGKSNHQCKNYYLTYRKKLGLDQVVAEYYQSLGEERRPCLTDEEESGSSTSSCDEMAVHDSSDTASAGSPANTISSSTPGPVGPSTGTGTIKVGGFAQESTADIRISLVPPAPAPTGSQQSTAVPGQATNSREDYDSSATTADEGQGGADVENANSTAPLTTSTSTSTILQSQTASQLQQPTQREQPPPGHSPPTTSNANPLTVKDLMFDVIEMQLKRNPNSTSTSSVTPTISSILKTDHRNDITFVREFKPSSSLPSTAMSNRDSNLATLSVVSVPHHRSAPSPQQIGQMQATITPMPPAPPPNQPPSADLLPKEGLVVMQVQQALRETEGTLDLSIKKPRQQPLPPQSQPPPPDYNHALQQPHKTPQITMYRSEPPPGAYYHPHAHEQGRGAKSPLVYVSSPRPQAPITPKMNKVTVPPSHPKLSPKLANMGTPHKGGSITHGTPVSGARYEGLLRQMTPPGTSSSSANPPPPKESGSITQGTPVLPFPVEKRSMYDYHRPIRHSPATTNAPPQSPNQGVVVTHSNYNSYAPRPPPPSYTMEQQLSSRQIIMNDYITSQQMHQRRGTSASNESASKTEQQPATLYYTSTPPPPAPPQSHTQARQGVIQRHNPQKQMHYHPPPAGLEAFSSLVDVAVQQPSLPVPHPHNHPPSGSSHEGLGKTMADRLLADRYVDNNRAYREQELRIQEHGWRMAAAHQQQRDRERDLAHIREKEEHRLQREKELQQLEHRLAVQHHQREKDIQQERIDREKQLQHEHMMQQREKEERLREKEIQHQREQIAVHQREKEHQEHRMAQQREKEIQHQREQLAVHQREKEMREKQEHRMFVQREREMVHLHQHQRMQEQQQMQQHMLGQRMEAERRHMAQIYRDQQHQHIDRESGRLLGSSFSQSSRSQQSQQPPSQQPSASSRPSPASSNSQSGDNSSTLTAASLIDAIITHQINQSFKSTSGTPAANNQPTRPGDRLFQGFHRDTQAEPNGVAHSPAAESSVANSGPPSEPPREGKTITLGEHIEHIVTKDYGPPHASYRSYPGYPLADDQWKRREADPEPGKPGDERQIIRVSQGQQQSQPPPQSQQAPSSVAKQFHSVEPVSPPETTQNHYARRFYESTTATTTSGTPPKPHLSPLDYVKNKIVEVMRTSEDDKTGGSGERGSGNGTGDKDDKPAESPSGDMVIDESPNPQTQQPPPASTTFYPFSALGVHTGPPPAPPPPTAGSTTVTKSEQMESTPLLSAQYEPLSDED